MGHSTLIKTQTKEICQQTRKSGNNRYKNADILHEHYHYVFNHNSPHDTVILNKVEQKSEAKPILGDAPNLEEVQIAIRRMKSNKAPVMLELMTNMLKNLLDEGIDYIAHLVQ